MITGNNIRRYNGCIETSDIRCHDAFVSIQKKETIVIDEHPYWNSFVDGFVEGFSFPFAVLFGMAGCTTAGSLYLTTGDWRNVECEGNLESCREELRSIQPVFIQNLKRQLLLSLYASFFHQGATYEDIYEWLVDPVTRGSWERDPKMVVDVLDYFIEKQKIVLRDSGSSEMGNLLIVVRDLLKLTVPFRMSEPVHHPDLVLFFKPHRRESGIPLAGVKQGVAYYLIFLLRLSGGQLPDDALMTVLKDLSSNKGWASQVEALIKSRNTGTSTAPGRKKK